MDRLSIFLTIPIGAVIVGTLAVGVLTFEMYGWPPLIAAFVIGNLLTWPISYLVSRRIKRKDPDWRDEKVDETEGLIPRPGAKEV
jgi:putative flippase GtrA